MSRPRRRGDATRSAGWLRRCLLVAAVILGGGPGVVTGGDFDDGATNGPRSGSLVWYGDETEAGGKGDWTTLNVNWFNGTSLQAWASAQTAVFDAFGGEVTIGPAGIAAGGGLSFQAPDYAVSGGTLTLTGSSRSANAVSVAAGISATIAAPIAGTAGLTKTDGGTLTLTADSGLSGLSGGATVAGGTLRFGDGGTSGSLAGDIDLAAGGTLAIDRSNSLTLAGVISGAGGLHKAGEGVLTLTGGNTFTGGTAVFGGSVVVGDGATAGRIDAAAEIEVAAGTVLAFDRTDSISLTGSIAGSGTVEQRGTGTLTLSRSSPYGSDFTLAVAGGTVDLNRSGGTLLDILGSGNVVSLAGGTLQLTGGSGAETRLQDARIDVEGSSTLAIQRVGSLSADHLTADLATPINVANGATLAFDFRGQIGPGFTGTTIYTRPVTLASDAVFSVDNSAGGGAEVVFAEAVSDGGAGFGLTKIGSQRLTLAAANTYSGVTTVSSGTLEIANPDAVAASAVTVASGATLTAASGTTMKSLGVTLDGGTLAADTLAVDATAGIATLVINSGTVANTTGVVVGPGGLVGLPLETRVAVGAASLAIDETAAGGLIDLGSGQITVASGGITAADLRADIIAGRNGGAWDGAGGITSSAAAGSGGSRAVGYTVAGDGLTRVSFAAPGDTNLDGEVDLIDLLAILSSGKYDQPEPAVWDQGDFNYDGVTDLLDLLAILGSGTYDQGSYFPAAPASLGGVGTVAAVPEPGALQILTIGAVSGLGWLGYARRRKWG